MERCFKDKGYFNNFDDYHEVPRIWDIAYSSPDLFIAVGDSGTVIRTTDKGETWQRYQLDTNLWLQRIKMKDNYQVI